MVGAPADGKKPKGLQLHVHFALPTLPQKKKNSHRHLYPKIPLARFTVLLPPRYLIALPPWALFCGWLFLAASRF